MPQPYAFHWLNRGYDLKPFHGPGPLTCCCVTSCFKDDAPSSVFWHQRPVSVKWANTIWFFFSIPHSKYLFNYKLARLRRRRNVLFRTPQMYFFSAPLMAAAILMMAASKSNSHFSQTPGRRTRKNTFSKLLESLRPNLPDRSWTAEAASRQR